MKKLRIAVLVAMAALIGTDVLMQDVQAMTVGAEGIAMVGDENDSKDKKENKKEKKKKKKKDKKAKTADEVIMELQELASEWKKPARTGDPIDQYYDDADHFFTLLKNVADSVTIYRPVKVQTPSGKVEIMPVDPEGNVRHKNESFSQVMESASYVMSIVGTSTLLITGTAANAVQIGLDAVPFVGDPTRKKANVSIAKGTKAFPMLVDLMKSQRSMAKRYFKPQNVELGDDADDTAAVEDTEFMETMEMSDEDLAKLMEAELSAE